MRYHADASSPAFVSTVNVHVHTLKAPKRKVSASWSLATTLELRFDLRQGREVLAQAEPYQKWHSYASVSAEPWKGEQGFDLRKNQPTSGLNTRTWLADLLYYSGIPVCSAACRILSPLSGSRHAARFLFLFRNFYPLPGCLPSLPETYPQLFQALPSFIVIFRDISCWHL